MSEYAHAAPAIRYAAMPSRMGKAVVETDIKDSSPPSTSDGAWPSISSAMATVATTLAALAEAPRQPVMVVTSASSRLSGRAHVHRAPTSPGLSNALW
jgi:hypothetical protein